MSSRLVRSLVLVGFALLPLGGCTVYDGRFVFVPRIASVDAGTEGYAGLGQRETAGDVRTLVSVVGIRRADEASRIPASIEVRMRVENDGTSPVGFAPRALSLVSADLQELPSPIVEPAYAVEVTPGGSAVISAYFPLDGGATTSRYDLSGLNVQWSLFVEGQRLTSNAGFTRQRIPREYHYRHDYAGYGFTFRYFQCW